MKLNEIKTKVRTVARYAIFNQHGEMLELTGSGLRASSKGTFTAFGTLAAADAANKQHGNGLTTVHTIEVKHPE